MKKIAKLLALLLAMLMIVGCFAACSPAADPTEPDGTKDSVNVEATEDIANTEFMVAWWGGDARHNKTLEVLKDFDKKNPGLTTKAKYSGSSEFWTMLDIDIAGDTMPDVFQMTYAKIETYAKSGKLLDLKPYVDAGIIDLSNVPESYMDMFYYQGGMYAVPTGVNCPVWLYDVAAVKEAGCTLSRTPTLDEFVEVAKKVYDKTGKKAYMEFAEYVRMQGQTYYTDDGLQVGFTPELLAEFWKFEKEAIEYGWYRSAQDGIESGSQGMIDGKLWCISTYSNQIKSTEANTALDLEWMSVPNTDKNKATNYVQPNTLWCVSYNTDTPKLATSLLNYFTNDPFFFDTLAYDRGLAMSTEIQKHLEPTATEDMKEQAEILAEFDKAGAFDARPTASPYDSQAKQELTDYMSQNQYGLIDEANMLATAQEAIAAMNDAMKGGK